MPKIINAEFRDKVGEIPSFQEQIKERRRNTETDKGTLEFFVILVFVLLTNVVLFHPTVQARLQHSQTTINCKEN